MGYLSSLASTLQQRAEVTGQPASEKTPNPLTYPKSSEPFSHDLFKRPTSEYRGCPLWAWNTKLDKDQMLREIDNFADMGLGGFHMHVRTGLDTEYMGTEFMDIVRACVEYAESKKMLACLYDDDRWPSGAAGGKVIAQYPEHKGKHILFTPHLYGTIELGGDRTPSTARACRSENGHLLATYDILLDENGCLKSSRLLQKGESGRNVWYAYVETNPGSPWFNDQTYVDTLSHDAIAKFIETTHEIYKAKIGDKFGTAVPCIFTDEPQFATKTQLSNPRASDDIFLPWTTDLAKTFKKEYGSDLVEGLPQLVWNLPNGDPSLIRYHYHDHVCERFVSAFMDQLAGWCKKNNLMLDGHMMEEPTLYSQSTALGEAMRCYRNQQMPGMDLLVDWTEYNTAKQASSVSRQNGSKGTMSELYGVTHWTFTFEGHKGCGDWQAALGITFRVHHLTWVSMRGEGKRDYPACIGYQSPWYKEYGHVEDHFARVGVAMTRGHAVSKVGVIHPIESYWLAFGPNGTGDELGRRDQAFKDLTHWLLHGLIDFDFIAESLLPNQVGKQKGDKLKVGACEYDVVVVPNLRTIRSTTLKILRDFAKAGGKVIIAGSAPEFVDAQIPSANPSIEPSKSIYWGQQSVLNALNPYREIRITVGQGLADKLLYQMRQDGDERFVFICNRDRNYPVDTIVSLKGVWQIKKLDTFTGDEDDLQSHHSDGWTSFPYRFSGCGSLLLHLIPSPSTSDDLLAVVQEPSTTSVHVTLDSVTLSEPNVLLLDYASYQLPDTKWSPRTEVLRIDNLIRERVQIPRKGMAWTQPWAVPNSKRAPRTHVVLKFDFKSSFTITSETHIAVEDPETMAITINATPIISTPSNKPGEKSWWVDEAIRTVPIPPNTIQAGQNTIILSFPFGILTNIERIYILGDFGVTVQGNDVSISELDTSKLTWGWITNQGLPFYVGNIIYNCTIPAAEMLPESKPKTKSTLWVPDFSSPVLTVHDKKSSKKLGRIAFQPRQLELGVLKGKKREISITAYGNRYNAFGHLHLVDGITDTCWPDIWRTEGGWWTDNYNVKPIGILTCPQVLLSSNSITENVAQNLSSPTPEEEEEKSREWVIL